MRVPDGWAFALLAHEREGLDRLETAWKQLTGTEALLGLKKYPLVHRSYRERGVAELLRSHGLAPRQFLYYDFEVVPMPLDRLFPHASSWIARHLEMLRNTCLRRVGTGIIVRAVKE